MKKLHTLLLALITACAVQSCKVAGPPAKDVQTDISQITPSGMDHQQKVQGQSGQLVAYSDTGIRP